MPNPWSAADWNLTEQGKIVKRYGVDTARRMAQSAGAKLGDLKPTPNEKVKVYIIHGRKGDKGDKGEAGEPGAVIPLVIDEG